MINATTKNIDIEAATLTRRDNVSGTGFEYPVVADINGSGQAKIIIGGRVAGDGTTTNT
jgi:hypothetical protein